ncbi:hypothetical protein [Bdellovibrio sp. HCB2-146]|uniref:hypothetical protein n=1 Tax=Bdellovibrio sp. HCB2-146 TaxID=3394362 RepID=UPI0039BC911B
MKNIIMVAAILPIMLTGKMAFAGKVEDVQSEVKKACGKDLSKDDALKQVKSLFLSCVPGDKVDVDGCKVSCLKSNSGAVVGQ